jgi:hypothetical protein
MVGACGENVVKGRPKPEIRAFAAAKAGKRR